MARTWPCSLKRARNSVAASRSAAGRSPRGQVACASSNSWKGRRPTDSGLSIVAIAGEGSTVARVLPRHDAACVIHLHSRYSDGTGTVPEIAAAAARAGADVVLLTDHDTLEAKRRGEEGWHGPTLVCVGEEVSPLGENHFLAFGLDREIRHWGLSAAEIVEAVAKAGGFRFLAHPFSHGSPRLPP